MWRAIFRRDDIPDYCELCGEYEDAELEIYTLPPYQYKPLEFPNGTRIFVFSTTPDDTAKISGTLVEVDLDVRKKERLPYFALSYTWGSNHRLHMIECDGCRLPITCSLNSALLRLRTMERGNQGDSVMVFADCISINQATDEQALSERAKQVRLMTRIFKSGNAVIADLGEGIEATDGVLDLLEKLSDFDEDQWERLSLNLRRLSDFRVPAMSDKIWDQCVKFLNRRYFTRLWTIQELVLSSDLRFMIGTNYCPEKLIMIGVERAVHIIQWYGEFLASMNPKAFIRSLKINKEQDYQLRCTSLYDLWDVGQSVSLSLGTLLSNTRHFNTADNRDRVYAIMGMMKLREAAAFQIDYQETKPAFQKRLSRFLVEHKELGSLLGRLSPYDASTVSSWMIDIDLLPSLGDKSLGWNKRGVDPDCLFEADGLSRYRIDWCKDDDTILPVSGSRIDQVDLLSEVFDATRSRTKWREKVQKMVVKRFKDLHPVEVKKRCIRVMLAHGDLAASTETDISERLEELVDALLVSSATDLIRMSFTDIKLWYDLDHTFERERDRRITLSNMEFVCAGRSFCITKTGYMCLVPESTKQGDVLAIIRGCPEPVVLRKRNDKHFIIIGMAYVDGFMYGEALTAEFWKEEKFLIV